MKNKFINLSILISIIISIFTISYKVYIDYIPYNDKAVIHYIDVGQGDGILIQVNNKNILIDGGTESNSKALIKYLKSQRVKSLDYIIATHPHEDHIGALPEVINTFKIKNFYAPKVTANTTCFYNLIKSLKRNDLKILPITSPMIVNLDEYTSLSFISPNKNDYKNLNNYSLVAKLQYKNFSFLFTGDAEKEIENEIMSSGYDIRCHILKLGHHGSKTSSTPKFLDKVNPKIAIASCGLGNDYGHPSKNILKELKNRNITLYRTDKDGTIVFVCDGKTLKRKVK